MKPAKRIGMKKAKVAIAPKIAFTAFGSTALRSGATQSRPESILKVPGPVRWDGGRGDLGQSAGRGSSVLRCPR